MMATSKRTCVVGFVVAVIVALAILAVGLGYGLRGGTSSNHQTNQGQRPVVPMDPEDEQEDSQSGGAYRYAAVSTPTSLCSKIGTDILGKGGSAVDAAIAATICNGVVEPQSNGIGGGFFMTVHERPRGSMMPVVKAILSREVAPGAATQDMFVNTSDSSTYGGKAIGVPGEVRGYYEAWQMFGRIPWSDLWRPSICICKDGFEADEFLIFAMESSTNLIAEQPNLKSLLTKPDGTRIKLGEKLTCPKLASTFEKIAEDPLTFYHGQLADDVVADISEAGGIITIEDLQNYNVKFTDPVNVTLQNGDYRVYNPPPPSSGLVVDIILKLLDRYNLSSADYGSTQAKIETYYKMLEAFKFAYGRRSELGDIFFEDQVSSLISNWTSESFIDYMVSRLNLTHTQDTPFYEPAFAQQTSPGTVHISVLAPGGGSVSVTSTINLFFGSKVVGSRTGIVFNNQMDDFSTPGTVNAFGFPASPSNFIAPGKMPMSSMSPTIITDSQGTPVYVSGAAGGSRIISGTAFVALHTLWLGLDVDQATRLPRLHHQLVPNILYYEAGFDETILTSLERRGHTTEVWPNNYMCRVNSISQQCPSQCQQWSNSPRCVVASSDRRLNGRPDGF